MALPCLDPSSLHPCHLATFNWEQRAGGSAGRRNRRNQCKREAGPLFFSLFYFLLFLENTESLLNRFLPSFFFSFHFFPHISEKMYFLALATADFPSQRNCIDTMNNFCLHVKSPTWRWSKDVSSEIAYGVMWEHHSCWLSIGCTRKNTAICLLIDSF